MITEPIPDCVPDKLLQEHTLRQPRPPVQQIVVQQVKGVSESPSPLLRGASQRKDGRGKTKNGILGGIHQI
jgi:hypothetical protein